MAVNVGMKKSSGNLEKWPSHLETVDKPSNPPSELFVEMLCILIY